VKGLQHATAAGMAGRENEDFFDSTEHTMVLLDGAGTPGGSASGCVHGVAWFARTLGAQLLDLAEPDRRLSLADALAQGIRAVATSHADTCDLRHPGTPSSTVVMARDLGSRWDYLVLADSTLMLVRADAVEVLCDGREARVGRELRRPMDALASGSPAHAAAHRRYVESLRDHRNRPGGFWVASTDPAAAAQAITGSVDAADVRAVAVLSDGATRLVDRFGLLTWQELADVLLQAGPEDVIRRVRDAERSDPQGYRWPRGKVTDDATAAVVQLDH